MRRVNNQTGFTLIELLLAMTLFSTVMVVATVGFVGMNRSFTRGIIRKDLSEYGQSVTAELTRAIRDQGNNAQINNCNESACLQDWSAVCLGNIRYIWQTSEGGKNLYSDTEACNNPPGTSKKSLLSDRYTVRALEVTKVQTPNRPNLYRVRGAFTTSDLSALNTSVSDPYSPSCKGSGQSFAATSCAVEKFSFIVNARGKTND